MLTAGEVHVWRAPLDLSLPERESARGVLRSILGGLTATPLDFAAGEKGKPWLPAEPRLRFNLSHSRGMALVAAALDVEVGADVELLRPVPEFAAIADRFFPPREPAPLTERDFFRSWTRLEAMLKARGVGLYGAGKELVGKWTLREIDAGAAYAAAVAATAEGMLVLVHDFIDPGTSFRANLYQGLA